MKSPVSLHDASGGRAESAQFRREESTLVALNLLVLAALLLVHQLFRAHLGPPSRALVLAICGYFLLQTIELYALRAIPGFSDRILRLYPPVSVALKLLIAAAIAFSGDTEESHYAVLIVLPVMSAAFRFSLGGVMSTAGAAGILHIGQLHIYYRKHPPANLHEVYEAGTIVLIYFVIAVVVWSLAGQLRHERSRLKASLVDLQRTRDRLIEEEKMAAVGRLAGAIAHEIRNPVAMIKSAAELVRSGGLGGAEREEMCGILASEGRRLENLTSDFLTYARTKAPEPRPTPLGELLSYIAGLARARTGETGHEVRLAIETDLTVLVDPFQLQQAMLNLLLNALQAAPAGTPVILGAYRRGDGGPVLVVENRGSPIPEEVRARLFEPFFSTKERGTGLGLAIARNIARAHGGDLILARNEPDAIRFELNLPGNRIASPEGSTPSRTRGE